jgi:hypothetical protein
MDAGEAIGSACFILLTTIVDIVLPQPRGESGPHLGVTVIVGANHQMKPNE